MAPAWISVKDVQIVSPKLRLSIQGLRALAVGRVVIVHFLPASIPGGYMGVDISFVISGSLFTVHLLREIDRTDTVRLARFWARRVRRAPLIPLPIISRT